MHTMTLLMAQSLPEGRVFGLDFQTLIGIGIQLANGIILALVLGFILYKPVKEFMNNRSEKIQSKLDDSDATMARANELIAEYEIKIKDIDKERLQILEAARIQAEGERKNIIEEAKKEANETKKRSLDSIADDRKRLQEETRLHIIELASLMAQKYITQNINNEAQDKIFDETLAQLEATQWQN